MIRTTFSQVLFGVLLSGCTVNTYHSSTYEPRFATRTTITRDVFLGVAGVEEKKEVKLATAPSAPEGNAHIRPECRVYVPLPVPEPKRIDLKELEAAPTAQEINAIALRNVQALHQQLKEYADMQKKHYADYVRRCVIK
ncbi:hypothetical protein [Ralstonia phage RP31]|uniref:Lipoprotein n=1 Tax=Ralstonia phage RP31 TaxID=1923890 RepID=A0A1L7N1G1_9CAUD|nr:hypothetical protein [Ralstonia phage RP31]